MSDGQFIPIPSATTKATNTRIHTPGVRMDNMYIYIYEGCSPFFYHCNTYVISGIFDTFQNTKHENSENGRILEDRIRNQYLKNVADDSP